MDARIWDARLKQRASRAREKEADCDEQNWRVRVGQVAEGSSSYLGCGCSWSEYLPFAEISMSDFPLFVLKGIDFTTGICSHFFQGVKMKRRPHLNGGAWPA